MSIIIPFTIYDTASGKIAWIGEASPDFGEADVPAGHAVLLGSALDETLFYVPGGEATPRPILSFDKTTIVADGVDAATLELPGTFTAEIDGSEVVTCEDELKFVSDMTGTYEIVVNHFPYQRLRARIMVISA